MPHLSKAHIKLSVGSKYINNWNEERNKQIQEKILNEFQLTEDDAGVEIIQKSQQTLNLEFTAVVYSGSVSAVALCERLERAFFDLEIYKREVKYSEEKR